MQKRAKNAEVNQHIGLSRGRKTTKIHAIVDGLGNPVSFQLSSENSYDGSYAIKTLSTVELARSNILGDKAYNSTEIRGFIETEYATYNIPPKPNAKEKWSVDWIIYKERHLEAAFMNSITYYKH